MEILLGAWLTKARNSKTDVIVSPKQATAEQLSRFWLTHNAGKNIVFHLLRDCSIPFKNAAQQKPAISTDRFGLAFL